MVQLGIWKNVNDRSQLDERLKIIDGPKSYVDKYGVHSERNEDDRKLNNFNTTTVYCLCFVSSKPYYNPVLQLHSTVLMRIFKVKGVNSTEISVFLYPGFMEHSQKGFGLQHTTQLCSVTCYTAGHGVIET